MPQRSKGPRLYLRAARGGHSDVWVIRDRSNEVSTGCRRSDIAGAEKFLQRYIALKYEAPKRISSLVQLSVNDVMAAYLREHAPHVANKEFLRYTARPIIEWWADKTLADVRASTCHGEGLDKGSSGR